MLQRQGQHIEIGVFSGIRALEGLAPTIVKEIEGIVEQIREVGITTIIVEQNALAVLKYSDRAVILDTGVVVYDGPAQEVLENDDLRNRYLAI